MTDDRASLWATFSDFKLIKSRKQVQLVFEIPLEKANEALTVLGGMPNPAAEVWCALARLASKPEDAPAPAPRLSRSFHTMTPGQQAGILGNEVRFRLFLSQRYRLGPIADASAAAEIIRAKFGVLSRSDIPVEGMNALISDYRAWQRDPDYAAALEDAE